ncbi:hypothetical protein SAMN05421780_101115 [Flexibacter flexilis DSM 6793]|uniref:HEAT repeat-containing protein n=1 Tax=Flexibacter flexilis DSM 6793 TaxID=927664 RepID=A0A1I1DBZ6_9BACT|nr:hypothetical protein [Flexibacter flexilis]SFB72485.1 hypothetical protein SAMN05421780_101115 [Flexibacter flexilis DSM 6793]
MLLSTQKLIKYLKISDKKDISVIQFYINVALLSGNKSDSDALLKIFLSDPTEYSYSVFFDLFFKFGDKKYAEEIYSISVKDGILQENMPCEILELFGRFQFEPTKNLLIKYALNIDIETDHYLSLSAIQGLLYFDCTDYHDIIKEKIEACYDKNIFSEFVPTLVCKLRDKKPVLERLYETGCKYASTDCNAGIVLGFSLCGDEGKKYFLSLLFDKHWEMYSTGTGNTKFAYKGLLNLKISILELFRIITTFEDIEQLSYGVNLILSFIECKADDYTDELSESFLDIYTQLFLHNNTEINILKLARKVASSDRTYHVKKIIELKIMESFTKNNYLCAI